MIDILKSLRPQKGKITLKDGIADLDVPEEFRYLDAADSRQGARGPVGKSARLRDRLARDADPGAFLFR